MNSFFFFSFCVFSVSGKQLVRLPRKMRKKRGREENLASEGYFYNCDLLSFKQKVYMVNFGHLPNAIINVPAIRETLLMRI